MTKQSSLQRAYCLTLLNFTKNIILSNVKRLNRHQLYIVKDDSSARDVGIFLHKQQTTV